MKKRWLAGILLMMAAQAGAASFPEKPVTLVVPYPPGGGLDMIARPLAESMSRSLGVQVIVENVGGAGGTIGSSRVARSRSDGYTLLLNNNAMATSPILYPQMNFDIVKDLLPVGAVTDGALVLVGRKSAAATTAAEALAQMRDPAGTVNFATAGPGSLSFLGVSLLQSMLNSDFQAIQYKGTGPAMADLLGGRIDFLMDQLPAARLDSGDIVPLAVTTKRRTRVLPDVPTLDESGLPGYELSVWQGIYAPIGTPDEPVRRIGQAIKDALRDETFLARLHAMGIDRATDQNATPQGHAALLKDAIEKWQPLMKAAAAQQ